MKNYKKFKFVLRIILCLIFTFANIYQNSSASAQIYRVKTNNFREVVEKKIEIIKKSSTFNGKVVKSDFSLEDICPIDTDSVAKRIFIEYGAIFVSESRVNFPTKCIFENQNDIEIYQNESISETVVIGGTSITLQKPAMEALLKARKEAAEINLQITPRGGPTAGKRSYNDTARFWNSRFDRGLVYWSVKGKISRQEVFEIKNLPVYQQIKRVLEWENDGIYFSTNFSKSILYSVAAPGASQHIFMLALDVEQFENLTVRNILAKHGWFQTVKSDLPHFTYLGIEESKLPSLGLVAILVEGHKFWIPKID